jgi:excisionase family DNA binding protein
MNDQTHSVTNTSFQFANNAHQLEDEDQKKTGRVDDARKLDVNNLPDLLTVREVADLLRVSPLTIKRWGKRGKLPAIRINSRGDRRYKKEAVLWLLGMNAGEEDAGE